MNKSNNKSKLEQKLSKRNVSIFVLSFVSLVLGLLNGIAKIVDFGETATKVLLGVSILNGGLVGVHGVSLWRQNQQLQELFATASITAMIFVFLNKRLNKYKNERLKREDRKMSEEKKKIFKEFLALIKSNPFTISSSAVNVGASGFMGYAVYFIGEIAKWNIPQWALGVIACVVALTVAIIVQFGIIIQGWETREQYLTRREGEIQAKQEAELEKEAAKKIKEEQEKQAELEKQAREKIEAEKAAAEKAKEEAEYQAMLARKIAEIKAKENQ